ncbi:NAD(P)-binding domain-containing protein [Motiliproteus sediminis]|uniref:NAD(P)-dependent oxidoreductase n=1 Tax=Motiliproteus sediminis TaxID=1468178 RepID=UPI0031BB192A
MTAPSAPVITFVGIGLMGQPMATNLIKHGFSVCLWNRTLAKAAALASNNARVVAELSQALTEADVVITMLESGPVVDALLYQSEAYTHARAGTLFIDMSSIPPAMAQRHSQLLNKHGCHHLDAPVSGGTVGAAEATLSIMAGGSREAFTQAQPLFDAMGTPHYIGPSGSGQLANWPSLPTRPLSASQSVRCLKRCYWLKPEAPILKQYAKRSAAGLLAAAFWNCMVSA